MAPFPAIAQVSAEDREIAERMMSLGRLTPDEITKRCAEPERRGDIVVCGQRPDEFRIPSTGESDPDSKQALDDGRLHTPDVAGGGIFKGKATMGFGKVTVPYMIDLSSIPEAPEGSDADRIARGEMRAD
jgi:hypothetical protein